MAADGTSNLEIIISAVDEASAAIEEVNASFASMSEAAEASTLGVDGALTDVAGSFGVVTASSSAAADQFLATWTAASEAVESYAGVMSISIDQVMADMEAYGISAQQAADEIVAANAAISVSTETTAETVDLTKGSFTSIGVAAGIAFAAVISGVSSAISSAKEWNIESATIAGELKVIGSSIPLSEVQAYAQQVQATTLITQQQALQSEGLILSFKQLAPNYQSLTMLSADLATKMAQTSGTMADNMPNATKILTEALANPVAGFSQLTRQANVNIPAAMQTMIENMAKVGNTAGADALILQELNGQVGGLAEAATGAPGAALTQMSNQLTALGTTIGNALLPDLDALAKALLPIIQDVSNWVQEHPKLTEAILASVVAFTALLTVLTVVGIIVAAVGSAFAAFGIAIAAVIALIIGVVIANWGLIETKTEETWGAIQAVTETVWTVLKSFFTTTWNWIRDLFNTELDGIGVIWDAAWTSLSDFLTNIWNTIRNTVKSGIDDIITGINAFINALDAIHISIPSISIPGTKLGTPAINLGFNIPNLPMLADGGFVTQPTLALIGEAGPEAVIPLSQMGAGGAGAMIITVNVNGGIFPADSSSIRQIGNILAKQIVANVRVKNYAS